MFSLNPYEVNQPVLRADLVSFSALLSEYSRAKKLIITDCQLEQSELFHCVLQNVQQSETWTVLTVEKKSPSIDSPNLTFLSVDEQYGYCPPFMPLQSFCLFQIVKEQKPDLVIVEGTPALAYYILQSKEQSSWFSSTSFLIYQPTSRFYNLEREGQFPSGRTDIELNCMEKNAFPKFDLVIEGKAASFVPWANSAGWKCPGKVVQVVSEDRCEKHHSPRYSDLKITDVSKNVGVLPRISVCLITYNRPDYLEEALRSLERQTYENYEVIVVDDGSHSENRLKINILEEQYTSLGWRFCYQENSGPAKARNLAAQKAKGSYLLFMDDDNLALVNELQVFAEAAIRSNADILTCIPGWHPESDIGAGIDIPIASDDIQYPLVHPDWIPIGGDPALGILINCFGDTNALFRKKTFDELGGFSGDRAFVMEDMEIFSKSVVAGYRLEVVPEVLFLYRKHKQSRSLTQTVFTSHIKTLMPFSPLLDESLWPLLLCLRKGFYDRHNEISSSLSDRALIERGEWISLSKANNKFSLTGGGLEELKWFPDDKSRLSFRIKNPGRNHCLVFECVGRGILKFSLSNKEYEISSNAETESALVECKLHAGALHSNEETVIIFKKTEGVSIARFAVMQLEE